MRTLRALAFALFLAAAPTSAQEVASPTGTITGEVLKSSTNEPIAGATILVTGTPLGGASSSDGTFRIDRVPAGTYALRVSSIGCSPRAVSDVVVTAAKPAVVRVILDEADVEFGEVSITADYFRSSPDNPVSTQTQSNEEIRRLPGGFEDVVRAVSILPGVARVQGGRNDLIVRGGAPSENLFLIENIEVPNINHFGTQGASGGPLSYINLDMVSGTTFSTGGFGARYGNRLSSVLAIDLRDGRTDRLGGKATLAATQFGLNAEGPLSDRGSFLFSARRSYLDLIFKAAGFGFVPEYWDFLWKGKVKFSSRDQISLLGIGVLDNVRLFNDSPDHRYDNAKILVSNQNQFVVGLSWLHLFPTGFATLTLANTYNDYDTRQNDTLLAPIFTTTAVERQIALKAEVALELVKGTDAAAGVQGTIVRTSADLSLRPFWTNYGLQLSTAARAETSGTKFGWYAQVSHLLGRFRLTGGVRGDLFTLLDGPAVFAPRVSASYAASPATTVSMSAGTYYQDPALIWLAANPANRSLRPVRVDQYVAGIGQILRPDTKVSVELYWKHYREYPVSTIRPYLIMANTGAGFGGSEEAFASYGIDPLVNAGRGDARGVEFAIQKKLSEIPCYGTFNVSYNESRFVPLDGIERPGSFDQRWILNLGGGYLIDEHWEVSAKFRLATGRPYTPYETDGRQAVDRYNAERIGVNHALDLRVDRRWPFARWSLITYLDIQNVYNRKAVDVPRYNERLGQTEQVDAIGILPSIGISAEF